MPESAEQTRVWLQRVVVGLDLCPFARGPLQAGRVRIAVSDALDLAGALGDLGLECERLVGADPEDLETTLVVYPNIFRDFGEFCHATLVARDLLQKLGVEGVVQLADFHPDYVFADVPMDDPANATNRSPHPVWHLLRESSVGRAAASHPDIHGIPARNEQLLRGMHSDALRDLLDPP